MTPAALRDCTYLELLAMIEQLALEDEERKQQNP